VLAPGATFLSSTPVIHDRWSDVGEGEDAWVSSLGCGEDKNVMVIRKYRWRVLRSLVSEYPHVVAENAFGVCGWIRVSGRGANEFRKFRTRRGRRMTARGGRREGDGGDDGPPGRSGGILANGEGDRAPPLTRGLGRPHLYTVETLHISSP
jgi:hypothetical protein